MNLATAIPLRNWATAAAVPDGEPGDPPAVIPAIRLSKSDSDSMNLIQA